jgi:hypothetical protein
MASQVISLGLERNLRKLRSNRDQLFAILHNHRSALTRLFDTGVIFHRDGSRAARDLLLAHELLHQVLDLLDDISDSEPPSPERSQKLEKLQKLLARTSAITAKTGEKLKALIPPEK